jgi:hypothetical protein
VATTDYTVTVFTALPLTKDQAVDLDHVITMLFKSLEHSDKLSPKGNLVQQTVVRRAT